MSLTSFQPIPPRLKETEQLRETIGAQFKKLLTANLVVRLANFSMWKVSTSAGKVAPQEFITGESNKSIFFPTFTVCSLQFGLHTG